MNTIREPLLVLDQDLRVVAASRSFYTSFDVISEATLGRLVYELGEGEWNIPALRHLLERIVRRRPFIAAATRLGSCSTNDASFRSLARVLVSFLFERFGMAMDTTLAPHARWRG